MRDPPDVLQARNGNTLVFCSWYGKHAIINLVINLHSMNLFNFLLKPSKTESITILEYSIYIYIYIYEGHFISLKSPFNSIGWLLALLYWEASESSLLFYSCHTWIYRSQFCPSFFKREVFKIPDNFHCIFSSTIIFSQVHNIRFGHFMDFFNDNISMLAGLFSISFSMVPRMEYPFFITIIQLSIMGPIYLVTESVSFTHYCICFLSWCISL